MSKNFRVKQVKKERERIPFYEIQKDLKKEG